MRRLRPVLFLAVPLAVAIGVWWLVPNPFVRGLVAGLVAAPAVVGLAFALFIRHMRKKLETGLEPPPLPAGVWDYRMTVTDLAGDPVAFEAFRDRVLVVNFWGTWCAPCVAEMPSLTRLREATRDFDVAFACVTRESAEEVERFLEKTPLDLPIYLLDGEPPEVFRGQAIPATFILDRSGMVAMRHFGAAAWDDERVVAFVRGLAAEPE